MMTPVFLKIGKQVLSKRGENAAGAGRCQLKVWAFNRLTDI